MLGLLLVVAAAASSTTSPLTIEEALRLFRERGFDLIVAAASVTAAEGDLVAAAALPNPLASGSVGRTFGYDPAQCAGCSALQLSAGVNDQGLLSDLAIGKRRLRTAVARAALEAARGSRQDAQRILEFQLKQQFLQAALAHEQVDLARESAETSGRTRELNQRRFEAGAISETDLARVEVQELEARQAQDAATQQFLQAKSALRFLLGGGAPLPDFDLDPAALEFRVPPELGTPDAGRLLDEALHGRPDLRAFEAQLSRAEAALGLARRQRIPDVPLGFTWSQEGSGQNALLPPTFTLSTQIALPVFYLQSGEIRRAQAEVRSQTALRDKARAQVVNDVHTALYAYETSRGQVERMQGRLLERARRARDLVRVQYEKGAASLLELLDAQRTYVFVRGEYLQNLTSYWTAVAQLEQATARELRR